MFYENTSHSLHSFNDIILYKRFHINEIIYLLNQIMKFYDINETIFQFMSHHMYYTILI